MRVAENVPKGYIRRPRVKELDHYSEKQVRRKPKKKLTPLQENRLLKIILLLVIGSLAWLLFAPGTGVYSLLKMRSKVASLETETSELVQNNEKLQEEIERLKNDLVYLEEIAREKYGLIKQNETVFDFSRPQKDSTKEK